MNLENCRYVSLSQTSATLDSTQKNCCRLFTDGEELKNSYKFFRRIQQCSSSFACPQGQAESNAFGGWIFYLWLGI